MPTPRQVTIEDPMDMYQPVTVDLAYDGRVKLEQQGRILSLGYHQAQAVAQEIARLTTEG